MQAIVFLYDYDQKAYNQGKEFTYNFAVTDIQYSEIASYRKIIAENTWKHINYRNFSLTYSPHLSTYDFSLKAFEKAITPLKE